MSDGDINNISSLGLAHIGDAVFELIVRTRLALAGGETASGFHKAAVKMVNAKAQAVYSEKLINFLSGEEEAVFRRGRNSKVNSIPKNTNPSDYHAATGLEALFGYLYLKNREDRINELFNIILENRLSEKEA